MTRWPPPIWCYQLSDKWSLEWPGRGVEWDRRRRVCVRSTRWFLRTGLRRSRGGSDRTHITPDLVEAADFRFQTRRSLPANLPTRGGRCCKLRTPPAASIGHPEGRIVLAQPGRFSLQPSRRRGCEFSQTVRDLATKSLTRDSMVVRMRRDHERFTPASLSSLAKSEK